MNVSTDQTDRERSISEYTTQELYRGGKHYSSGLTDNNIEEGGSEKWRL